jgi:hypothetical protein
MSDIVSEFVFLNHEGDATIKTADDEELSAINSANGEGITEVNRQPQNGAEAYENLVKSLTECDAEEYAMKDIAEDAQIDESFGLDNTILDQFSTFSRDTELFQ